MSTDLSEALGEAPATEPVVNSDPTPVVEGPEVVAETEAETPEEPVKEAPKEEPQMVPLAALHEERQKRQELDRRLQAIERAQPKPEPKPTPDVIEDPQGFSQHVSGMVDEKVHQVRMTLAEDMATREFGKEKVAEAREAFEPHLNTALHQQMMDAANPYAALVEWHQQQQDRAAIDAAGGLEKWMAAEREKIRAEFESQAAVKDVRAAPSLAAAPNAGSRTAGPAWTPTSLSAALGEKD